MTDFLETARRMAQRVREYTGADKPRTSSTSESDPGVVLDENGRVVSQKAEEPGLGPKLIAYGQQLQAYPAEALVGPGKMFQRATPAEELKNEIDLAKVKNDIDRKVVPVEAKLEEISPAHSVLAQAVRKVQELQSHHERQPIQMEREFSSPEDKQAYVDQKTAAAGPKPKVNNDLEGGVMGGQAAYNQWLGQKGAEFRKEHMAGTDRIRESINAAKRWGAGLDQKYEQKAAALPVVRDIKAGQQKLEDAGMKYVQPWLTKNIPVEGTQAPPTVMPEVTVEGADELKVTPKKR